ncbi:MAG: circularly permuted type 2 ATP-grasp protein [Acidobacteria bacterium]|nr:circularly permuted type 2 ATP-grasp protein [Acidobacteriota bacterium]
MLKKAVAYYHELLEDAELAEASRRELDEGLERARLIFGGRRLTPYLRPHFVAEADWTRVCGICETVWSALQKVKDAAVESDELLDELGVTEIEKDLVAIDPKYRTVSPTARLDSFLTDNAYSYVELNGESPAGIAYADSATDIFLELPVMKKFAERYEVRRLEGRSKLLDVLLRAYEEYLGRKPEQRPVIAIVDLRDLPTQQEFELFRDFFEANGCTALITSPDELEFDGERLYTKGVAIDIVYKRLLVNEYLPIMEKYPALVDAYRAGAVCMVNSFRSKLIHKKAVFAVLTNEKYAHLFNDEELRAIHAHIPWTRKFREEKTVNHGAEIDLVDWTRANKSKLVLKPNDDYGGHGIYIGWVSTEAEWEEAMKVALVDGDYLVQERVETSKESFPMLFGEENRFEFLEQLVDLDPLLYFGKVGSAFTRLSTTELANVSSGGGMVPTLIIKEKNG